MLYESVREVHVLLETKIVAALAERDMRADHFNALRILAEDGRRRMGELAERLLQDDSRTTRVVDQLETDGLVERRPDPSDRRAMLVVITRSGRRRERETAAIVERAVADSMPGVSEHELATVTAGLASLKARIVSGGDGGNHG